MEPISTQLLPASLTGLTPEWLTNAMRQSGALRSSAVKSVELLNETLGNGMAAQISRIGLRYDQEEDGQPRTLVVKRPAADPNLSRFFESIGAYRREVYFYQEIAGKIQMRTPRCYFGAYTPDPADMILLLEDLGEYDAGDWGQGCTVERSKAILREIAILHAAWWMSPQLDEMKILMRPKDINHSVLDQEFAAQWPTALELLGLDSEEYRAACQRLEGTIERAYLTFANPPRTMVHLDVQLDNMVFGRLPGQAPLILLDWATAGCGNPAYDLAFFLCQNLDTPLRRAYEVELISEYLSILAGHGVQNFSLDVCLTAYRSALPPILQRMIGAMYSGLPLPEKQARVKRAILDRLLAAVVEHC